MVFRRLLLSVPEEHQSFFTNHIDQQKFFDAFVALLANPRQSYCTNHFIGCLAPIGFAVSHSEVFKPSRPTDHDRNAVRLFQRPFLLALASWMLEPRSEVECEALWSPERHNPPLCEADCNLGDPFIALLHEVGSRASWRHSMACSAFEVFSGVLVGAAEEIRTAKVGRRVKKAAETTGLAESWPTSIRDILGNSTVEAYMKQMEIWVDVWPAYSHPWSILGSLALLYPRQFLTPIVNSETISCHFISVLMFIHHIAPSTEPTALSVDQLWLILASTLRFFEALLNDLTRPLLIQFVGVNDARDYPVMCTRLLHEIARLQSTNIGYNADDADRCVETLLRLGSTVHACMGMADQLFSDVEFDPRMLQLSHAKRQRASDAITGAFDAFCALAEWQRCLAPDFTAAVAPGTLRQCANCKRVLYCSETCHAAAWTYPNAPHKELCKLIASLVEHTAVPSWPDSVADLPSFYQRVNGNAEMEQMAKDLRDCFKKLGNSLEEELFAKRLKSLNDLD
ncbi:hypothetical protein B0H10DRAFT_2213927 [Mycena sp. CBHHK59/15]|nr:hypothetical protein B0H10DRAFT_2213927 [Mycena sp. CBHHK59/15]